MTATWSQRVKRALQSQGVQRGIGQALVAAMPDHIDQSKVRGPDGESVDMKPLKRLEFTIRGRNGRTIVVQGRRNGRQPLRDTGALERSLDAVARPDGEAGLVVTVRGEPYGEWQNSGFTTSGPNFIPISNKGRREHGTGQDPRAEGLRTPNDYIMARRGVKVPARPFMAPTNEDLVIVGKTIFLGLQRILKGR